MVRAGPETQSGTLSPLPVIKIGGIAAAVQFAGLVAPGEFQFNLVVPASLLDGDQPVAATYNGSSTQFDALLTVHH
jgi:uncharacterized protein (TIGR03437 family)